MSGPTTGKNSNPKVSLGKSIEKVKNNSSKQEKLPKEDCSAIIKWNLPTDLVIEILALTEDREFEYLLTFDKRCINIKNSPELYKRLLIRRLERYLNPQLTSFTYTPKINVPTEKLVRGLELFKNTNISDQIKYAAYYTG